MFVECRHVQPSGEKCKSPAVRNSSFCYFHRNLHDRAEARPPRQGTPFLLPVLEDSCSILIAVNEVFRAMGESRIKRSEASTYFYGIQIAAKVITRIENRTWEPVRALEYDNSCTELAPEKTACEPLLDCVNCDRQDICEARKAILDRHPGNQNELINQMRSMSPQQALAKWDAERKAADQRMRNLRSLAVQDDYQEPTGEEQFPQQKTSPRAAL
jgi:hypothetical protein